VNQGRISQPVLFLIRTLYTTERRGKKGGRKFTTAFHGKASRPRIKLLRTVRPVPEGEVKEARKRVA